LTIAEKTLASLSKKGLDTGSIVGITLSLVIAGIGGVVMFLKGRKDDAKQNAILNQVAIGMGTMGKVQKSNPAYNDNSVGEDMYSDTEVTKCQSYKATGKDCAGTKTRKSEYCKKHTCGTKGCQLLKSSKADFCKMHAN
jgi:hypothetical protein